MPRYVCPSCGAPFNGKKCRNCAYESFSEEITHNLHVHKGEPLIIKDTGRRPIPYQDPFDCPPTPQKRRAAQSKKKKSKKLVPSLVILILLYLFAGPLVSLIIRGASMLDNRLSTVSSTEAVEQILPTGEVLYEDDNFTVQASWPQDDTGSFPIYITNHTDRDYSLSGEEILVNGYCLDEFSGFYTMVSAGTTGRSYLTVSDNGLLYTGISQVQELSFRLQCTPTDDTPAYLTEPLTLTREDSTYSSQLTPDFGDPIYEDEYLRLYFVGLFVDSYAPESLEDAELIFCAENLDTDATAIYSERTLLNGDESSVTLWANLPADCKTIFRVYLYGIEVDAAEDIRSLSMELRTFNDQSDRQLGAVIIPIGDQ